MGALLDLLFPGRCPACGAPGWPLCRRCALLAPVVTPPTCARCGRPSEEPLARCADCPPRPVDAARAPFLYRGPVASAIRALKFGGWRTIAPRLATPMAEAFDLEADAATWVPLSPRRRSARGFDQAEALARSVARRLGLPATRLLARVRETPVQARAPGALRRRALRGAFATVGGPVSGTVLLVDDVLTTGATAADCARALRRAGATRVVVLTAARSVSDPVPARCFDILSTGPHPGLWLPGGRFPGSRCQPQAKRPT